MSIKSVVNMWYRQKKMQEEDDRIQVEAANLRRRVLSSPNQRFIDRLNSGYPTNFHPCDTFKDTMEKPMEYQTWWHILVSTVPFLIFLGITVWNHYKGSNNCEEKAPIQTDVTHSVLDNVLVNDVFSGNRKIKLQTRLGSRFSKQPAKHIEL